MAAGGAAVGIARLGDAACQHGRRLRLTDNDLGIRPLLAKDATHALERTAGAEAGYPEVEPLASEVPEDFLSRGTAMHIGIGLVLELPRTEPAIGGRQFVHLADHPRRAFRRRREHHLGAEEAHQAAPFDRKGFGHDDDERIALLRADHGEADAGIAAGRLDHRLAGFESAGLFGRLDDAECQPVLNGAKGVESLNLHPKVDALGRELVDPDHRRIADGLKNVGVTGHGRLLQLWGASLCRRQSGNKRGRASGSKTPGPQSAPRRRI